jgi:type 1 fimbria pilin
MKAKIFLAIALIISVLVNAQERTITGKVTDETGSALPGVNISIKGKAKGTTCDVNGKYSIQVQSTDVLIF